MWRVVLESAWADAPCTLSKFLRRFEVREYGEHPCFGGGWRERTTAPILGCLKKQSIAASWFVLILGRVGVVIFSLKPLFLRGHPFG